MRVELKLRVLEVSTLAYPDNDAELKTEPLEALVNELSQELEDMEPEDIQEDHLEGYIPNIPEAIEWLEGVFRKFSIFEYELHQSSDGSALDFLVRYEDNMDFFIKT